MKFLAVVDAFFLTGNFSQGDPCAEGAPALLGFSAGRAQTRLRQARQKRIGRPMVVPDVAACAEKCVSTPVCRAFDAKPYQVRITPAFRHNAFLVAPELTLTCQLSLSVIFAVPITGRCTVKVFNI